MVHTGVGNLGKSQYERYEWDEERHKWPVYDYGWNGSQFSHLRDEMVLMIICIIWAPFFEHCAELRP